MITASKAKIRRTGPALGVKIVRMPRKIPATAAVLSADKLTAQQQPAHQHGAASLQVSLDGRALQIALDGPADNLLGFEHAPRTEAQKKAVAHAEQQLKQPLQLFATPPAAECRAEPARVEIKLPPPGSAETHSEIEAEWRWDCAKPGALAHLDDGALCRRGHDR